MGWKTHHEGTDGARWWYRHCRHCAPACVSLGLMSEDDAQAEVERHDLEVHARQPRGARASPSKALGEFIASRRVHCSEGTIRFYVDALTAFFKRMEGKPFRSWRPSHVLEHLAAHPKWSARSKQKFLGALRTFRTWAVEAKRYDVPDFTVGLKAPRVVQRQVEPLSAAQLRALLAEAKVHPWLEAPIALAAYAGLALGDIRSLEWSEVRWESKRIVRPRDKNGKPLDFKIGAGLLEVLERHRVIAGPICRGLPTSDSAVGQEVRELYARAGVPRERFQGLHFIRTSFVSLGLQATGDLAAVSDVVGDNPGTVARHYAKSRADGRDRVVDAVDRALAAG